MSSQAKQIDAICPVEFWGDSIDDSSRLAVDACTSFDPTDLGTRSFERPVAVNRDQYVQRD